MFGFGEQKTPESFPSGVPPICVHRKPALSELAMLTELFDEENWWKIWGEFRLSSFFLAGTAVPVGLPKLRLTGRFDFAKAAALPDLRGTGDRIGQHEVACATRATPNS